MTFIPIPRYFNPTVTAQVLGNPIAYANGEGLNMKFTVKRSTASTPDSCRLSVQGLDPLRARLMGKVFAEVGTSVPGLNKLTLQAGYDVAVTSIFIGDLRSFRPNVVQGPSLWTFAEADDGGDAYSDAIVPNQSTVGQTALEMISQASTAMGLGLDPSVAEVAATRVAVKQGPFTAVGVRRATDLLNAACRRLRCRWWIRDGLINLGARGVVSRTRPAVVLAGPIVGAGPAVPGLPIITPLAEEGSGVVTVTTFFDPNLVPGSQVVYNATAFRIEAVIHSGETRGTSPWASAVTGRAL